MSDNKQSTFEGNTRSIESSDFQSFLKEQLLNPIVKQEYDALEEEYSTKRLTLAMQIAQKKALVDKG